MSRLSKKRTAVILYGLRFLLGERSDENISCKAAAVCCWKESVGGRGGLDSSTSLWASRDKQEIMFLFLFIRSHFLCARGCFTTGTDEENKTSWCSLRPTSTFNFLNCGKLSDCSVLPHPSQFGLLLKPGNTLTWNQQRWMFCRSAENLFLPTKKKKKIKQLLLQLCPKRWILEV